MSLACPTPLPPTKKIFFAVITTCSISRRGLAQYTSFGDDVKDQEVRTSSKLNHMPHCNLLLKCFLIFLLACWGGLVTLKALPEAPYLLVCTPILHRLGVCCQRWVPWSSRLGVGSNKPTLVYNDKCLYVKIHVVAAVDSEYFIIMHFKWPWQNSHTIK